MGLIKKLFGDDKPQVSQAPTMTPEQQQYMNMMMGQYSQYMPGLMGQMNQMAMNPQNTYNRSQQDITDYYHSTMRDPAMYAFQNETMPALEAQYGNKFHSSAKTKGISRTFADLKNNLSQQRGNLFYNELLQQQQGTEIGLARQMQAMGMMQQGAAAPMNVRPFENMAYQDQGLVGKIGQVSAAVSPLAALFA